MRRFSLAEFLVGLINFTFGLALIGLGLRFLFRLFGASVTADFTQFLYESTAPLLEPFRGIFQSAVIEPGNVFEFSTLIAMAIYTLIAWLLVELVRFVQYSSQQRG